MGRYGEMWGDMGRCSSSCIMHSSRAGRLKQRRSASAYFGLTNSRTAPPEPRSAASYSGRER